MKIRPFENKDTDAVVKIWLDASIAAHCFMGTDYWRGKEQNMRNIYLPAAETYVYEANGCILGFISMIGAHIAALFVSPGTQGRGTGTQLMDFAKECYGSLELTVYKENMRAVAFYEKQGFRAVCERMDENTGHTEIVMVMNHPAASNRG